MGEVTIRSYHPEDRAAVRRICFETGYMGEPIAWAWRDAESFADLFSAWYTDHEPESATVAELDGEVVGYLLGCRDSTRAGTPVGALSRHLVRRGLAVRPGTAGVIWRATADLATQTVRTRRAPETAFLDDRWPAHLHIDLLPEARGLGVGRRLMTGWLDRLRDEGIPGCHLGTWAENDGAIAFFESQGFIRRGEPTPMPGIRSPEGHRHHTQLMVQTLRPEPSGPSPTTETP